MDFRLFQPLKKTLFVALAIALTLSGIAVPAFAASEGSSGAQVLPKELGEVIYQKNPESLKQIYIVGQSHRSAVTGANGEKTVQAQAEIFRIGEWLIRNEGVRLLLPEGYFQRKPGTTVKAAASAEVPILKTSRLDDAALKEKLSDTSVFVNADILLKDNYPVRLFQVENEKIYQAVGTTLRDLQNFGDSGAPVELAEKIEYLQELRSAAMLQNICRAVDAEYSAGAILNQKALFNIGMAHLDEMIRFLSQERIDVKGEQYEDLPHVNSVVDLVEAGYGVTVILPRTLVDDQEALKMARLESN